MKSLKCTLTIRDILGCAFIFASFFHGFSSGITWIQTPREMTYAEKGESTTLHWHFDLSENETHFESELIFLKGNMSSTLATRNSTSPSFQKTRVGVLGKFDVLGTNNIVLIVEDVQENPGGLLCLKIKYMLDGIVQGWKMNCTEVHLVEQPLLYSGPQNVTINENETMMLHCKARGTPSPKITWTKGNSKDIIATGETLRKRVGKCDAGVYRCTADNVAKRPVSAQASVKVKSYPEAPEIFSVVASTSTVEINWKQPPVEKCSRLITGYLARARKNGSNERWMECETRHVGNDEWACSFSDLETGGTYIVQVFARNEFGTGKMAKRNVKAKVHVEVDVDESPNTLYISLAIVGGVIIIIAFALVCLKCCS